MFIGYLQTNGDLKYLTCEAIRCVQLKMMTAFLSIIHGQLFIKYYLSIGQLVFASEYVLILLLLYQSLTQLVPLLFNRYLLRQRTRGIFTTSLRHEVVVRRGSVNLGGHADPFERRMALVAFTFACVSTFVAR